MDLLQDVSRDVRHACRLFAKSPGFVAVAVISLAFGTGANVAIFSATDALLLRPLPVPDPGALYAIGTRVARGREIVTLASYPDFVEIRDRSRSFAGLAAFVHQPVGFALTRESLPRTQVVTFVNAGFFEALGIVPAVGRTFRPAEDAVRGRDAVAVLSHSIWQRDFGSDPSVIGRRARIGGIEFTVIGVAPASFTGMEPRYVRDTIYVPLAMYPPLAPPEAHDPFARDLRMLRIRGRLAAGVSPEQARAELAGIAADLARTYPASNEGRAFRLESELQVKMAQEPFDVGLVLILSTLSIAVLCVACANVAGLLTSRAAARSREIALRVAIGAGRGRIVRQLFAESLILALAGGALGVGVGYAGIALLRQLRMPTAIFAYPEIRLDERTLVFSLAASIVSAFLFGLAPAMQTAHVDLVTAMKAGDAAAARRRPLTGRNALVAGQVALSLVLATIAIWAFGAFRIQFAQGPGFRTVRMAKVTVNGSSRRNGPALVRFFDEVLAAARRAPAATSVTLTSAMPLFSFSPGLAVPDSYRPQPGDAGMGVILNSVDEAYFETLEIPILAGRAFVRADDSASPRVAIVNDAMARRYWPGQSAVGRRFRLNGVGGPSVEIVGVARTAKYGYFIEQPQDMVYLPFRQEPHADMVLVAATNGPSGALLDPLAEAVRHVDPDAPISDSQTIETFIAARTTAFSSLGMRLIGAMGVMGMILTTIGLYALVSYAASRRTREIGIRIAVGATPGRVLRMILHQGMRPVWWGAAAGLLMSAGALRILPSIIPAEAPQSRWVLALAIPILIAVALLASLLPARQSARVDPTRALRAE